MKWNKDKVEEYIREMELQEGEEFQCFRNDIERELDNDFISKSAIAIKVVSIFGGMLAGLLFLGFLFLTGLLKSETSMIIIGLIFVGTALFVEKLSDNDSSWKDSLCLSVCVVGYASFLFGLFSMSLDYLPWFAGAIVAGVIVYLSRSYILVFLSTLAVVGCLYGLILEMHVFELFTAFTILILAGYTWLTCNEIKFYTKGRSFNLLYSPVQAGMFTSSLYFLLMFVLGGRIDFLGVYPWVLSIFIWVGIFWLMSKIIAKLGQESIPKKRMYYLITFLILLPTLFAPAISGALFLLLLSFYYNYKSQVVCSIAMLIYVIVQYYYDLGFSLLVKSGMLFFSGIMFLALWFVFNKKNI